uniref:Uncharacterized protein n=1 Tax=Arundo donax TaxID=35708 RepID=A0A0A8YE65_ARUDO
MAVLILISKFKSVLEPLENCDSTCYQFR